MQRAAPEEASALAEEPKEEPKIAAVVPPQSQQQLAAKKAASAKEISITAHAERPRKSQVSGKADKADIPLADDVSAPPAAPLSTPPAPASPPTVTVSSAPATDSLRLPDAQLSVHWTLERGRVLLGAFFARHPAEPKPNMLSICLALQDLLPMQSLPLTQQQSAPEEVSVSAGSL